MRKLHTNQMKAFYLMPFKYLCASMLFLLFSSHLFAADILMGQYEFTTGISTQLKATSVTQGITMGDIIIDPAQITTNYTGNAVELSNWTSGMSISGGKCINLSITKGITTSQFNVNSIIVRLKRTTANKIQINFGAAANTSSAKMYAVTSNQGTTSYVSYTLTEANGTGAVLVPAVTTTTPQFFAIGTQSASTSEVVYIDWIQVWGTVTTTPAAPTITSITPGDSQLSVAFTAGGDGNSPISNYEYSTNGGSSWTTPSPAVTTSPLTISSLTNGTPYDVQLRAVNAVGSGTATASTSGTPTSASVAPGAPSITSITSGNTQLSVAFTAGVDGGSAITNYEYSTDTGSTWTTRSPIATTSPILISSLINGTSYNVQIRALNAIGTGAATASTAGTPSTTPSAPTITAITTSSDTQLSVAFTAGATGGSAITNYLYSIDGGLNFLTRQTGTTASPIVITGLTSGTAYNVQIKAVNENGEGTATATTASTTYLFYEDFAGYDATATTSTSFASLLTMSNNVSSSRILGWTGNFLRQYKAGSPNLGTVCLGSTGNDSAYITTPEIDLSQPFTLSFKARSLNNATDGRFNVYLDGTQLIYSGTDSDIALTDYTTPAFVGTATSKLTFTGRKVAGNEIIIDRIVVNKTTCSSCDLTLTKDAAITISEDKTYTNLSLAPGSKLTLGAGTLTVTNGLTLESDANGTATLLGNGSLIGTVNAKQYLSSARNWYVSSPVAAASAPASGIANYYEYIEAGNNNISGQPLGSSLFWKGINTGATLEVGKGYIAKSTALTTIQFSGELNNNASYPITLSKVGSGFNLVGNPYPAFLNWSAVYAANAAANMPTGTIWYRSTNYNGNSAWTTGTSYAANAVVYNGAGFYKTLSGGTSGVTAPTGTGASISDGAVTWQYEGSVYVFATVNSLGTITTLNATNLIPPMQAFWVQTSINASTLTISKSHCSHNTSGSPIVIKAPKGEQSTQQLARLQLSNDITTDEAIIYFNTNASNSFDRYDSPKMFNTTATMPEIYTQVGDEKLVINGFKSLEDITEVPLGFVSPKAGNFTLKINEFKNFDSATKVLLTDATQPGVTFDITDGSAYTFTADITLATTNRFSLIFRAPGITTGIDDATKLNAQVYVNAANQITIVTPKKSNYAIYNAVGQLIENGTLNSGLQTTNCKLQTGIYVVKVGNQSNRVIIK